MPFCLCVRTPGPLSECFHLTPSLTAVTISRECGRAYVLPPKPTSTMVLCIMIVFRGCADTVDVTLFLRKLPEAKLDFVQLRKATERGAAVAERRDDFPTTGWYKCRHSENRCISATLQLPGRHKLKQYFTVASHSHSRLRRGHDSVSFFF